MKRHQVDLHVFLVRQAASVSLLVVTAGQQKLENRRLMIFSTRSDEDMSNSQRKDMLCCEEGLDVLSGVSYNFYICRFDEYSVTIANINNSRNNAVHRTLNGEVVTIMRESHGHGWYGQQ